MMLTILALLAASPADVQGCAALAGWGTTPAEADIHNVLSMSNGRLTWNGVLISDEVLRQYLRNVARMSPRPGMVIDLTAMSCADRQRLAAEVEAITPCTPELCRAYVVDRPPPAPPPPRR